jgi:hypothetical protein
MFNIKSQLLGAAAVLPVAVAGLLGGAGSAEAAVLTGQAAYSGISSGGLGSPVTSVIASDGMITFDPNPGFVGLAAQTGSFTSFNAASINDISPIPGSFDPAELLLDFGNDLASVADGKNIFKATRVHDYQIDADGGSGSSIALAFEGYFIGDAPTEKSSGRVNLNFTSMMSVADAEDILLNGGANTGITEIQTTFSGMAVASTPEPTAMLGLGLVAAGMTIARRRKAVTA